MPDTAHPHIADELQALAVPIETLNLDPANARTHGERNLEAIKASLLRFGQRLPVVVQRQGMVVRAGNGRLVAARALGWTHLAAVVVDESSVDATAFAIADNRTAELAAWDDDMLGALLNDLATDGFDVEQIGFSAAEVEGMLQVFDVEPTMDGDGVCDDPRAPIQLMAFTLEEQQVAVVEAALRTAKGLGMGGAVGVNQNSRGNALTAIMAAWAEWTDAEKG